MKGFTLAAIAAALLTVNAPVLADDDWHGGGHGGSYNGHGEGHSGGPGEGHGGPPHGDGHGPGYGPATEPQGKNNHGRREHYGNGSDYRGGYNAHYGGYAHPGYYYPHPYYGHPYYGHPYYPYRSVGYPHYGGYPAYPYYGQHHNNDNHSDWPAYLIGGAVLGSVLTNVYHNSQAQQAAPAYQTYGAPQGRRLLRDLNGNCYERTTDGAGNELRSELPRSECNW